MGLSFSQEPVNGSLIHSLAFKRFDDIVVFVPSHPITWYAGGPVTFWTNEWSVT
jgi:hypothetical protein